MRGRGGGMQVERGGAGVVKHQHPWQHDGQIPAAFVAAYQGGDFLDMGFRAGDAAGVHGLGFGGGGFDVDGRGLGVLQVFQFRAGFGNGDAVLGANRFIGFVKSLHFGEFLAGEFELVAHPHERVVVLPGRHRHGVVEAEVGRAPGQKGESDDRTGGDPAVVHG